MSNYAYQDANRSTHMISTASIHDTGTWSSTGTYVALTHDVVSYGTSQFIAIIDNIGGNPTVAARRNRPAKWSPLVRMNG